MPEGANETRLVRHGAAVSDVREQASSSVDKEPNPSFGRLLQSGIVLIVLVCVVFSLLCTMAIGLVTEIPEGTGSSGDVSGGGLFALLPTSHTIAVAIFLFLQLPATAVGAMHALVLGDSTRRSRFRVALVCLCVPVVGSILAFAVSH